ncbi:MAG: hypothetical protein QXI84_08175 [Thermofilaceae archaeon]
MRRLAFAAAALLVAVLVLAQELEVIVTYLFTLSPQTSALTVRYPMPLSPVTDARRVFLSSALARQPVTDARRVFLSSALARQLRSTAVMYGVNLLTGFYHYSVTEYPPPVNLVLPRISSVTASTGAITLMYTIPVNATIQPPPPSQPPEEQQPPGEPGQPGQPPEEQPPPQPPEEQPPSQPPEQPPGEQPPEEQPPSGQPPAGGQPPQEQPPEEQEEEQKPVGLGEAAYRSSTGLLYYTALALLLAAVAVAALAAGYAYRRRAVIVIEVPSLKR